MTSRDPIGSDRVPLRSSPVCSQCSSSNLIELATAPGRFRCAACQWLNVIDEHGSSRPMVNPFRKNGRRGRWG